MKDDGESGRGWCDAALSEIAWLDGPHVALTFTSTFANPTRVLRRRLVARWVGALQMNLEAKHPMRGRLHLGRKRSTARPTRGR